MYYDKKIPEVLKPLDYYKILIGKINYVLSINKDDKTFIKYKVLIDSYISELKPKKEERKIYPSIFDNYLTSSLRSNLFELNDELFLINCFINDIEINDDIEKRLRKIHPKFNSPLWILKRNYINGDYRSLLSDIRFDIDLYSDMAYKNDLISTYYLMIYYANLPNDRFDYGLFKYWADRLSTLGLGRGLLIDALSFEHTKEEQLTLIKKAADLGDAKAQFKYASLLDNNTKEYVEYMISSADNYYKDSAYYAGLIFEKYGLYEEAYSYFLKDYESENCLKKISEYIDRFDFYASDEIIQQIHELEFYGALDDLIDFDNEDEEDIEE